MLYTIAIHDFKNLELMNVMQFKLIISILCSIKVLGNIYDIKSVKNNWTYSVEKSELLKIFIFIVAAAQIIHNCSNNLFIEDMKATYAQKILAPLAVCNKPNAFAMD